MLHVKRTLEVLCYCELFQMYCKMFSAETWLATTCSMEKHAKKFYDCSLWTQGTQRCTSIWDTWNISQRWHERDLMSSKFSESEQNFWSRSKIFGVGARVFKQETGVEAESKNVTDQKGWHHLRLVVLLRSQEWSAWNESVAAAIRLFRRKGFALR